MDHLEVVDGQGKRRRVPLDRPRLLIGREPTCDIYLPHPGVSRRHAQLQLTDQGRWLLQDLRSRNHIYVENKPVQQFVLEPRRPFRIADYWLMLQDSPPPPDPGAADLGLDDTAETGAGEGPGEASTVIASDKGPIRVYLNSATSACGWRSRAWNRPSSASASCSRPSRREARKAP